MKMQRKSYSSYICLTQKVLFKKKTRSIDSSTDLDNYQTASSLSKVLNQIMWCPRNG